jgi:hypothetical protein
MLETIKRAALRDVRAAGHGVLRPGHPRLAVPDGVGVHILLHNSTGIAGRPLSGPINTAHAAGLAAELE